MNKIDKRNKLAEGIFDYHISKDGKVMIYWQGKQVTVIKGKKAQRFIQSIDTLDELQVQLALAKFTGNFKRGNERR